MRSTAWAINQSPNMLLRDDTKPCSVSVWGHKIIIACGAQPTPNNKGVPSTRRSCQSNYYYDSPQ